MGKNSSDSASTERRKFERIDIAFSK